MERYIRNQNMLTEQENQSLKNFKVVVVGCGGLGGYIIEMLARLGIGHITMVDGDVFEESNLNRQLLSTPQNIGRGKAFVASERVNEINPEIRTVAIQELVTNDNAGKILAGHDVVCDALDNLKARRLLEKHCEKLGTPMVLGAIAGWYAQVCTIMPGDCMIDRIFPQELEKGAETFFGNPSFTPALAASVQVAEVLKILLNRGNLLRNKILSIDLLEQTYQIVDL
jgi:molybdopterin/thiamine biosynthesis adenylyltransferase